MDTFCGGGVLWDTELTWSNNRSYPGFTECFQLTVLVWIPSGWLCLAWIFYLPYLLNQQSQPLPSNWRNISKIVIGLFQFIIILMQLVLNITTLQQRHVVTYFQALLVAPIIEAVSLGVFVWCTEMERRKGVITSAVLFTYWFLTNLSHLIPFYLKIMEQGYSSDLQDFFLFNLSFIFSVTQLILSCIVEVLLSTSEKAPCPESRASFLSRITFHWIQKLVVTGYHKTITEEDMFSLKYSEQSESVNKIFESKWTQEEAKVKLKKDTSRSKTNNVYVDVNNARQSDDVQEDIRESTPLLGKRSTNGSINRLPGNGSINNQQSDIMIQNDTQIDESSSKESKSNSENREKSSGKNTPSSEDLKNRISLLKVLLQTFGCDLLVSQVWRIFYDILLFVNPFLLMLLIDFAQNKEQPDWKGYVFGAGFFLVIFAQSLFYNALIFQCQVLGVRIRTALINCIFKKSLRMNNQARTVSTIGEIVNFMSVDAEHIEGAMQYAWCAWSSILEIVVSLVFLYYTVGYAMFAGLGIMVILIPVNAIITDKNHKLQEALMEQKDSRMKLVNEILNGIKILKLYAWEMAFGEKVTDIRAVELKILLKEQLIYAFYTFSWTVAPFTVGLATYATYVYVQDDHKFDAQTAFVAMTLFNILRFSFNMAPVMIMEFIQASVSLKRIQTFLNHDDLDPSTVSHNPSDNAVSIKDGSFSWDPSLGPCLKKITLDIPRGSLTAIVGTVGNGKSSLLSAILGEMEKVSGTVNVDGSTAYVCQQAWIQNASVRDNILFGNEAEDRKYKNVVEACALQSDIDKLQAGDLTEIGEKGINLSGGQRQRVSLARSVYFDSDIYLLDDPLSAVDAHVGKHIFDKVIGKEGLLQNKTRILVTHGLHWLPHVERIVVLSNGMVSEVGSYEELLSHDGAFAKFLTTYLTEHKNLDEELDEEDEEEIEFKSTILKRLASIQSTDEKTSKETLLLEAEKLLERSKSRSRHNSGASLPVSRSVSREDKIMDRQTPAIPGKPETADDVRGKLIVEEDVEIGNVSWSVYVTYARAVGIYYTVLIIAMFAVYQTLSVWASIWLTDWTSDPNLQDLNIWPANSTERRARNDYYLGVYGAFGVAQGVVVLIYGIIGSFRMVKASGVLHHDMLINVLRCPTSFFDTTPVGRIVNRFSQDIESIDEMLPTIFFEVIYSLFGVLSVFVVIAYSTPIFLVVMLPLAVFYVLLQRFYIPTSRQLKRIESKSRSPIYNNFSEALAGVSTIRAFRVQERFIVENEHRVDYNQAYGYSGSAVDRWLLFRLEMMSACIVFAASLFAVLERHSISGAIVGLSISYSLQVTEILNWLVLNVCEFETNIVSVERVRQYSNNKTEAALYTEHQPQDDWPTQGEIHLQSYSTKYRDDQPLILKNVNITFKPGEKVGIVGRTGAGKSSLALSLFRLIEPETGTIYIDGEDVTRLGLFDLRSRLTILPQEPVLFSGSLRINLDPLHRHGDADVWTVLDHAHLKPYVEGLPDQLQYEVGEGGQNLSVGQRQLICLARSLLRKSKILVLDEATAAVDMETDSLIQKTIREEFKHCTVITIAHRLNTVMDYDRILVLSDGRVKEFDSPQTLLQHPDSLFYSMAKDAGLC